MVIHELLLRSSTSRYEKRLPASITSTDAAPSEIFSSLGTNERQAQISNAMAWFPHWLKQQLAQCSPELFDALPKSIEKGTVTWSNTIATVWTGVASCLRKQQLLSIDDVVNELTRESILDLQQSKTSTTGLDAARALVFAIIGWQTMLYQYDSGSSPINELKIADDMDGYVGQSRMVLKQHNKACKRSLPDMLMGFGVLLPPSNFVARSRSGSGAEIADSQRQTLESGQLNAYLLHAVTGVRIRWTDSLSCHLEFDPANDSLFLFRYPSFCAVNLIEGPPALQEDLFTPIYACTVTENSSRQWASTRDVRQMLHEVLLSYRLLFGQSKQSRKLFRTLKPFSDVATQCHDPLLADLCGRKQCQTDIQESQRDTYYTTRDFPILQGRLVALQDFLCTKRPRTWIELWRDKRDSGQWYTFWAVLLIGSMGVLLGFLQVVLQIVQIVLGR